MKMFTRSALAVLAVTLLASGSGKAATKVPYSGPCGPGTGHSIDDPGCTSIVGSDPPATPATPEIDPTMSTGALALVGGSIVAIRGRRRKTQG